MVSLNWTDQDLAAGLRCYRAGKFFEAHEHWEAVWLRTEPPAKLFVQALIQITAAFHHLSKGNRPGALSLLGRALDKLNKLDDSERSPKTCAGADIAALRAQVRRSREVLEEAGGGVSTIALPHIGPPANMP